MKNLILKFYYLVNAIFTIALSMLLFLICLGRISINDITVFYAKLVQTPLWIDILYIVAGIFLCTGLIFVLRLFKKKGNTHEIILKDSGELIRIPARTINDFVLQIINRNENLQDSEMSFTSNGGRVNINIACIYAGHKPVSDEIRDVKEILKGELKRIFKLSNVHIDFNLDSIVIKHVVDEGFNDIDDAEEEITDQYDEKVLLDSDEIVSEKADTVIEKAEPEKFDPQTIDSFMIKPVKKVETPKEKPVDFKNSKKHGKAKAKQQQPKRKKKSLLDQRPWD